MRRTEFSFQTQPGKIGPYMEWLAAAWGEPYGIDGDAVLKITALFAPGEHTPPVVRARAGGLVLSMTIPVESLIADRPVGTPLPHYLNALRPVFLEVSKAVASALARAVTSLKPPYREHWTRVAREIEMFVSEHGSRDDFGDYLTACHQQKAQEFQERLRSEATVSEMPEESFWQIVESFRGSPSLARSKLAALSKPDLASFLERFRHCLWELDRLTVVRGVYGTTTVPSSDDFIDARAAIISAGRAAYVRALEGHVEERASRAEWLLDAAADAIEQGGGHIPMSKWSIESGSNPARHGN